VPSTVVWIAAASPRNRAAAVLENRGDSSTAAQSLFRFSWLSY
jgi:hypothetical protein